MMKNGQKWNFDLSQFLAILRLFKGYQTAFVVCKMVKGVPMIPRNNQDNILLQYMSKYWAKMGQNSRNRWKMLKNAQNETSILAI